MTKKLTYACLYADYLSTFEALTDEVVGRLIRALLVFLNTGEELPMKGAAKYVWPSLRDQFLRDQKAYAHRCEQNRRNAQSGKRGKEAETDPAPDEESTDSDRCSSQAKPAKEKEKKKEKKKEKVKENEKENEKKNEKDINTGESNAAKPPRPRFSKPSVEDIKAYCLEKGFSVDPEAIWDFYESKGWTVGNAPMKDWKAAVRNWMRKEKEHGKTKKPAAPAEVILKCGLTL